MVGVDPSPEGTTRSAPVVPCGAGGLRGDVRHLIEMAPAWGVPGPSRGVVATGPVGLRWLGRSPGSSGMRCGAGLTASCPTGRGPSTRPCIVPAHRGCGSVPSCPGRFRPALHLGARQSRVRRHVELQLAGVLVADDSRDRRDTDQPTWRWVGSRLGIRGDRSATCGKQGRDTAVDRGSDPFERAIRPVMSAGIWLRQVRYRRLFKNEEHMRALVVYESLWGNTEKVARAIADQLSSVGTVDFFILGCCAVHDGRLRPPRRRRTHSCVLVVTPVDESRRGEIPFRTARTGQGRPGMVDSPSAAIREDSDPGLRHPCRPASPSWICSESRSASNCKRSSALPPP